MEDYKKISSDVIAKYNSEAYYNDFRPIFPNGWWNPSAKPNEKDTTTSYYKKVEKDFAKALRKIKKPSGDNQCIFCCERTNNILQKTHLPFAGGSRFPNFNPSFIHGSVVCEKCFFHLMISPLSYHKIGKNWFLSIQTLNSRIMEIWTKISLDNYYSGIRGTGLPDNGYGFRGFQNAVFQEIINILKTEEIQILESKMNIENLRYLKYSQITFFFWSNDNRNATFTPILFPLTIFNFYIELEIRNKMKEFDKVIFSGFPRKLVKKLTKSIDDQQEDYELLEPSDLSKLLQESKNKVLSDLLEERFILSYFIDKKHAKCRTSWDTVELYLIEVIKMDKKRIERVKAVGNALANLLNTCNERKFERQLVWGLERSSRFYEFFSYLTTANNISLLINPEQNLIATVDDILEFLFPGILEGEYPKDWIIIRDLLRILLYEKAGEKVKNILVGSSTTEAEDN